MINVSEELDDVSPGCESTFLFLASDDAPGQVIRGIGEETTQHQA